MDGRPGHWRFIVTAMFFSGATLLILSAITFAGILPFRDPARLIVGAAFAVAGVCEALVGLVFLRSHAG